MASVLPSSVDRILSLLKNVRGREGRWVAQCPAHDDQIASLSVSIGRDRRVLLKCHANCETPAIMSAIGLGMSDLFPEKGNGNGAQHTGPAQGVNQRAKHVKSYPYVDADGQDLFEVCRLEPKTFRQRRKLANGEWVWGLGGVEPVLYHLPDVIEAVSMQRRVFVVEGEKDADALVDLGYTATTNPMGAGKWRESYSTVLRSSDVVIFPDNDDTGRSHAEQVAASLLQQSATVRIVPLPGIPPKGDVSDWLAVETNDIDTLESLIGATPRWTGEHLNGRRVRWSLSELWENDAVMRPPPPVVPRLAWSGRSTLLAAREKSGKSTLIGYIAALVTRGGQFLGEPCERGNVLIIGLEEFIGDAARRLRLFNADGDRVSIVDGFTGDPRERPQEILAHIIATNPALVIVDSLAAYGHGFVQDDNNASQMVAVVQPLTDLAHSRGVALILVHHARKTDGRARGSTAITAGTDVVCEFFCPDETADPTVRRMRTAGRVPVQPVYDIRFDGRTYSLATAEIPMPARVITVIQSRPGMSMNDVVQAVGGRRDDVMRTVTDLLAKHTLLNMSDSHARMQLAVSGDANLSFIGSG